MHEETPEMQDQEIEYAGFWIRTGAAVIDMSLTTLMTFPPLIFIYGWTYFDVETKGIYAGPADFLISSVFPAVAIITFWILRQATPGKMAVFAKIVDSTTGKPASPVQLIGRYFAYIVSMLPLCLGFFWVAFDKRKQGWHDKLAGTVVIKKINTDVSNLVNPNSHVTPNSEIQEQVRTRPNVRRFFLLWTIGAVAPTILILTFLSQGGVVVNRSTYIGLVMLVVPISALAAGLCSFFPRIHLAIVAIACVLVVSTCSIGTALSTGGPL